MSEDSTNTPATGQQAPTGDEPTSPPAGTEADHTEGGYDAQAATEKIRKLNSEARNLRAKVKELEPKAAELDKLNEAQKSEVDKLTETNSELSTRAQTAERDLLRYRAAVKAGVAVEDIETFASRLRGETADELEADAEDLKKLFGSASNAKPERRPDRSQGATGAAVTPAEEFAAFMRGIT
ncbi:hypothetical protein [Sciscionella sediminilitoris]|uniref:hypothetical protein n=1 Tax=Sciscionella sediminilitoris TaxID=1445613 RepID=UPI0006910686|nr:hypothetical protein [Sciscionella sp. SE31]